MDEPGKAKDKRPNLVGVFIRKKREEKGLSQRALGQLFQPPVTTQFISNMERGATPLPTTHVPTISRALDIKEADLKGVMEQEYSLRLSGRLGVSSGDTSGKALIQVPHEEYDFFSKLVQAFTAVTDEDRQAFRKITKTILKMGD